jgi:threonine dehydrogenase-like Zn-dependent dehydrogenase
VRLAADRRAWFVQAQHGLLGWIAKGRVMKSMKGLRVVVVTDSEHGHVLAARLRRMEVAQVTAVAGVEEARLLCQSGGADACFVAVGAPVPDAPPTKESDAPGRCCGVPALMIAPVVTPQLRRSARRRGYLAAISATIPPRMLYRRLGAALQGRRAVRREPRWLARGMPIADHSNSVVLGKPTLH